MDDTTKITPPPTSKLDEWIAGLTARYADERRRPYPTAAAVTAVARDIERSFISGAMTKRQFLEAMPAFSDESRRRTAARLQAQSEAQRQDRVMASPDRIHGLRYYRRPWLNKDLVRL